MVDAVNGSSWFALPFTQLLPAVQIAGLPGGLSLKASIAACISVFVFTMTSIRSLALLMTLLSLAACEQSANPQHSPKRRSPRYKPLNRLPRSHS